MVLLNTTNNAKEDTARISDYFVKMYYCTKASHQHSNPNSMQDVCHMNLV